MHTVKKKEKKKKKTLEQHANYVWYGGSWPCVLPTGYASDNQVAYKQVFQIAGYSTNQDLKS